MNVAKKLKKDEWPTAYQQVPGSKTPSQPEFILPEVDMAGGAIPLHIYVNPQTGSPLR
jgi:hypothetical protein